MTSAGRREENRLEQPHTTRKARLKQPWFLSLFLLFLIPLLPEYCAPVLAIASLVCAHFDARSRGQTFEIGKLGGIILLYVLSMCISLLYADNRLSTLATIGMWLVMFCGYMALVTVLRTPARLRMALRLLTAVLGVLGLIACIQYVCNAVFHLSIPLQLWNPLDEWVYSHFSPIEIRLHSEGVRVGATYTNPNIFAEAVVMFLPFAAYMAFTAHGRRFRWLWGSCLLLAVAGTCFSFSRGSYLAMLAIAGVFCLLNLKPLLLSRKVLIVAGILLVLILVVPNPISARLRSFSLDDVSISDRLNIWSVAIVSIAQQPLFGLGAGVMNSEQMLLDAGITGAPHTHNLVLQLLVEGGIIALCILLAAGYQMVRSHWKLRRHAAPRERLLGVAFLAFFAGFVVFGMVDFPFLCPKLVGNFLIVLALSDVSCRLYLNQPTFALTKLYDVL